MTAAYLPAAAAEFPNDNPALHNGARWVCLRLRGPARALWQAKAGQTLDPADPTREKTAPVAAAPVERRYDGPMQLDLGRILILHRVENVPPPPDFIFRPFVSSRRQKEEAAALASRIDPRPCRVVDERDARRRVERRFRVDVAPCLDVGTGAIVERRVARRRSVALASVRDAEPAPAHELAAASA